MASEGRELWALCWVALGLQVMGVQNDGPDMDEKGGQDVEWKTEK